MSKSKPTKPRVQSEMSAPLMSPIEAQLPLVNRQDVALLDVGAQPTRMTNHLLLKAASGSAQTSSLILIQVEKFWGQFGDGWRFLVLQMCVEIEDCFSQKEVPLSERKFKLLDCKEKFGRLSVAYESSIDVSAIVDDFETRSEQVCDVCSSKGRLVRLVTGWQGTRCDAHEKYFS
jgi:hypothetical protein